jgi:hypothetical protein
VQKDSWKKLGMDLAKQNCQFGLIRPGTGRELTCGTCPPCRARALRAAERKKKLTSARCLYETKLNPGACSKYPGQSPCRVCRDRAAERKRKKEDKP